MDALNDPGVESITWMSSSQVGKTEVLLNIIGYFIDNDPSPILVIQPTQKPMAEDFSKDRLSTMLRDTICLHGKVNEKSKKTGNTILHKSFPGGHVTMAGANSPSNLASRPIRVLLADEIDRYPLSAGTEGDPLSLGEKRTTTFWNRKIVRTSTPTIGGQSRIEASFKEGDQRHYEVPCPHCGEYQRLKWSNIVFDKNEDKTPDLDSVHYECSKCKAPIEEVEKRRMLIDGEWVASKPFTGHASFHISALYSPWMTWRQIVKEWSEARGDHERMKVWTNTVLGETFREEAKEVSHSKLLSRKETYSVPDEVLVAVSVADIQEDRIEALVMGYGLGEQSWPLEHRIFRGDPTQPDVWDDFRGWLATRKYEKDSGEVLTVAAAGVDSGFLTNMVYEFVNRTKGRIFALKGVGGERPIVTPPSRTQKVPIYSVGVDAAKDIIFSRLEIKEGPGACHFAQWCDEEFFLQLTAEKAVIKKRRGFEYREWQKIRPRNEILDLYVYSLAVLYILNPVWEALVKSPVKKDKPKRAGFDDQQKAARRKRRARSTRKGYVNSW